MVLHPFSVFADGHAIAYSSKLKKTHFFEFWMMKSILNPFSITFCKKKLACYSFIVRMIHSGGYNWTLLIGSFNHSSSPNVIISVASYSVLGGVINFFLNGHN